MIGKSFRPRTLVPRRTVVILTDRQLFPCREGNQARIIELIRGLREVGYTVVLVGRRIPWHLPKIPALRSTIRTRRLVDAFVSVEGTGFGGGSPRFSDLAPYVRSLREVITRFRPIAVIAEYLWMAPCLDVVPEDVLRVVDTHDVMHERSEMYRDQPEGAWVECTREEEASLLRHADVVIAIQKHEQEIFANMLPDRTVICVPHGLTILPRPTGEMQGNGNEIAFIGSRIQGNVAGLHAFLDQAWPAVRARCPGARLQVYGEVATRLDRNDLGVHRVGYVPTIAEAYRTATVVINPVTLGTGLKIKTVEALVHGKAVVTTTCGAAGLEAGAAGAFIVEDDMKRFGIAVADLLEDPVRRGALEQAAHQFAASHFGRSAVLRALCEVLDRHERSGTIQRDETAGTISVAARTGNGQRGGST